MTELERLAALETYQRAHLREHTYMNARGRDTWMLSTLVCAT